MPPVERRPRRFPFRLPALLAAAMVTGRAECRIARIRAAVDALRGPQRRCSYSSNSMCVRKLEVLIE